jgi:imidazolonepropionase-like amidohydrolase
MFNNFCLLFFILINSISIFPQQVLELSSPATAPIVFANVTVIDVKRGKRQRNMTIVVRGDRIAAVGRRSRVSVPVDARIIDARGKFLIPGLWDMHIHAWDPSVFYPVLLANGVTGIRNMGGDARSLTAFRQQIETGKHLGPRIFFGGQILDGLRRETLPFLFSYVGAADEARAAVRQLRDNKADFIKVYNALTPDVYAALVEEAKGQNLPVAGHVPISVGVRRASLAGQRSIEHLAGIAVACAANEDQLARQAQELLTEMRQVDYARMKESGDKAKELQTKTYKISNRLYELTDNEAFDTFDQAKCTKLYELFRRQNTWQVPTLAVIGGNSWKAETARMADERIRYFPEFIRGMILQNSEKLSPQQFVLEKKRLQTKLQIVRDMHQARVSLLAGSDAPNGDVYPGFSLHDELELLVQAGLSRLAALQTATINPALFFNKLNEFGTVEQGKLADLILLDDDPLDDIKNTRRILVVVVNGRLLTREALDKMLSDAAAKHQKTPAAPK